MSRLSKPEVFQKHFSVVCLTHVCQLCQYLYLFNTAVQISCVTLCAYRPKEYFVRSSPVATCVKNRNWTGAATMLINVSFVGLV